MKKATIEVAEYVLPKFEVAIESPDHFSLDDGQVRIVIRAKYTHGKPMKGAAIATISYESMPGFVYTHTNANSEPLTKKYMFIDGRETIAFSIEHELKFLPQFRDMRYKIEVDLTETLTGLLQSTDKVVTVHKDTYEITTDLRKFALKTNSKVQANVRFVF